MTDPTSDRVLQATEMISALADCALPEAFDLPRERAVSFGQELEDTALGVIGGVIRFVRGEASQSRPKMAKAPPGARGFAIPGGSWGASTCSTPAGHKGHLHVEAYREHWHPISRYFERRVGTRRASTYVDVDAECTRVAIEYRASSFWSRAGRIRVRELNA